MKRRVTIAAALAVLCLLGHPSPTRAQAIPAGYDLFETDSGTTYQDISLPSDFFGPGSDPFEGQVAFEGTPFDCWDPDGPGPEPLSCGLLPTDTIVRRLADADPDFPSVIPVEIVELSLRSASPVVVSLNGGTSFQTWDLIAEIHLDPSTGTVNPPQSPGSMVIAREHENGGTFESTFPVLPNLTFVRTDVPGTIIGPFPAPEVLVFEAYDALWCHTANPLGFPADQVVVEVPGLTTNFFPGIFCDAAFPPLHSAVSFSLDGGAFNLARTGGTALTPLPNPAEGLTQPDPRHPNPNDVYATGTATGAQGYATEGEIFQSAASGRPANQTNVDRMSAALGIGPVPGGPPFTGPFQPNPTGAIPAPSPPGVTGPPGSFGPPPGNTVGTLGLVPDDNVDALSYGRDSGNVLLFSVSPVSTGAVGSAVNFEAVLSPPIAAVPPFPTNPGGGDPGGEAAGDVFKSVQLANFGRFMALHFGNGRFITPAVLSSNQVSLDEILLGLQAPAVNGSGIVPPEDDLDGMELSGVGDLVFGVDVINNATGLSPSDGIPDRPVFFSVDTASPSNGLVLGPQVVTPDDILVTPPGGFAFAVFADGLIDIGLLPGDDLDAVVISDVGGLGVMDPVFDEALFSLHPGSPSVLVGPDGVAGTGDEVSAADVFYTAFTGFYAVYAPSVTLGLLPDDNVDALDILPAALYPYPGPPPPPPPPPGRVKTLTIEEALLASHGIRVSEKGRCNHFMRGFLEIEIFGQGIFTVPMEGPAEVDRTATSFDPETAHSQIRTEIVSMDLTGDLPPFGLVLARVGRERGLEASPGIITNINPGIDFPAESFFDVYVEIEIPAAGLVIHNEEAFLMVAEINEVPPYGDTYAHPTGPPTLLFDPTGVPMGQMLTASLTSMCPSDADCVDEDPCTADSCQTDSGVCIRDPLPDTDGDGVCDVADNCAQTPNPGGQAPVVFGQQLRAVSRVQFCWDSWADSIGIIGNLAGVSTYEVDEVHPLPDALCFVYDPPPPPDEGLYFLVKEDCPAGSWQSNLGAEAERDVLIPF